MIDKCVICGKEIYRGTIIRIRGKTSRGKNAITCSKEHSIIYNRMAHRIANKYLCRIHHLKNKLEKLEKENDRLQKI